MLQLEKLKEGKHACKGLMSLFSQKSPSSCKFIYEFPSPSLQSILNPSRSNSFHFLCSLLWPDVFTLLSPFSELVNTEGFPLPWTFGCYTSASYFLSLIAEHGFYASLTGPSMRLGTRAYSAKAVKKCLVVTQSANVITIIKADT